MSKPPAEVNIDGAVAQRLLSTQHPDLAHLPLVVVESGWDNAIFRLGDTLAVRLPRREAAAQLVENEQRWLPLLEACLPLEIPVPVRVGVAQDGYPWSWSIARWVEGSTADVDPPDEHQGEVLATFFHALHQPPPADAPLNPYRGVPLAHRADYFRARVGELAAKTAAINPTLLALWDDALAAPIDIGPTWIHGDLHPRNVLVVNGGLRGVIDWGDMAQGDQAADLAGVWMLLPDLKARERAMAACSRVTADTWRRARGWALLYAVILLRAGITNDPPMAAIARLTLQRLLAGPR